MSKDTLEVNELENLASVKKKSVVHDVPITFHEIHFSPQKKTKQKLSGDPQTLLKVEDVLSLIMDYNYSSVELEVRDRYTYNISGIRLNKQGLYELVINCNDSQAEDIIKNNKKKKKTEIVSFNVDESHLMRCHIILKPLGETDGVCARMLLEGNRKVSEQTLRLLLQKILNEIDDNSFRTEFFEEDYAGTIPTKKTQYKMKYSIKVKTESVTDQEFINQLESGDFYHVTISEKNIVRVHTEAPYLNETLQTVLFKPVFNNGSKKIKDIYKGMKKLAQKKFGTDSSNASKEITYKICYPEGSHRRTVNFNPTEDHSADFAIKRKWINKFERQNKSLDTVFDNNLCRRIATLLKHEDRNHDKDDS